MSKESLPINPEIFNRFVQQSISTLRKKFSNDPEVEVLSTSMEHWLRNWDPKPNIRENDLVFDICPIILEKTNNASDPIAYYGKLWSSWDALEEKINFIFALYPLPAAEEKYRLPFIQVLQGSISAGFPIEINLINNIEDFKKAKQIWSEKNFATIRSLFLDDPHKRVIFLQYEYAELKEELSANGSTVNKRLLFINFIQSWQTFFYAMTNDFKNLLENFNQEHPDIVDIEILLEIAGDSNSFFIELYHVFKKDILSKSLPESLFKYFNKFWETIEFCRTHTFSKSNFFLMVLQDICEIAHRIREVAHGTNKEFLLKLNLHVMVFFDNLNYNQKYVDDIKILQNLIKPDQVLVDFQAAVEAGVKINVSDILFMQKWYGSYPELRQNFLKTSLIAFDRKLISEGGDLLQPQKSLDLRKDFCKEYNNSLIKMLTTFPTEPGPRVFLGVN